MDAATYAELRRVADDLSDISGAGAVEIADGEVIVMMSPVKRHELVVLRLCRQLDRQLARTHPGFVAFGGADIEDPGLGQLRRPDLMVFPEASLEGDEKALHPDEVLLVLEVVSKSNPMTDYEDEVDAYAAMRIPHYVIVDPRDGTGIVHSLPGYRQREKFVFGDQVAVGPWTLDTGVLIPYGATVGRDAGARPGSGGPGDGGAGGACAGE